MPVVDTTNSFANNEQITSTKLNNIMDNSFFVSGAVVPSQGLQITAGGQMQIGDGANGITTAKLADLNVTTAKIADGAITPAKLSTAGPSWDSAGGTFLLSQRVLEVGYGITSNTDSVIDFHAVHPVTDHEARIIRSSGENGTFSISNLGTGAITLSASGGVTFGTANMPNPVGSAPIYGCRAWVNFDGTTADNIGGTYSRTLTTVTVTTSVDHGLIVGHKVFLNFTSGTAVDGAFVVTGITSSTIFTVTHGTTGSTSGNVTLNRRLIRASGNVANVSLLGIGQYAVNFTTALPNANYARSGFANYDSGAVAGLVGGNNATTTTAQSCDIFTANSTSGAEENYTVVNVMFVG